MSTYILRLVALTPLVLLATCLGCSGGATPIEWPEAPAAVEEAPAVDLEQVAWPPTPEPLRGDVPWWANGFGETPTTAVPEGRVTRHAPRFSDAYERYSRANVSLTGELAPTVVFCNVQYTGGAHDPTPVFRSARRARADLRVVGRIASGHEFTAAGPNNVSSFTFGAPAPALRPGDVISVRASDRDFIRHDSLGALTLRYEGTFPLESAAGALSARCVALAPDTVDGRAPSLLRAADEALARSMSAESDPSAVPQVRFDKFEQAREAVAQAATWLSWASRDVQLRRARLDALLGAYEADQRAAYAALLATQATVDHVTLPSGVLVRAIGVSCESSPGRMRACVGRFSVPGGFTRALPHLRAHSVSEASYEASPTFARTEGDAVIYEVDLTRLLPRSGDEVQAVGSLVELYEGREGPSQLLLLRPIAPPAADPHAP